MYTSPIPDLQNKFTRLPWLMILIIIGIAVFGTAMLHSVTASENGFSPVAFRHISRFAMAFFIMLVLAFMPMTLWSALAYPAYFCVLVMLILVEFFGVTGGGAQRWLEIGPIRVQPSEFMKLALILALAKFYQTVMDDKLDHLTVHFIPIIMIAIPSIFIYMQPDLGTSLLLIAIGSLSVFMAGLQWRVIIMGLVFLTVIIPISYLYFLQDYQRKRIQTLLDPSRDPLGAGYHTQQSMIAIGSGGVNGKGYMQGTQSQLDYIPEQHTDFIFTAIAEEFGFVGSAGIISIWGILIIMGLVIAARCRHIFGSLAAAGAIITIAFYVLINVAMVIGLLPIVGIPMPLISYGGTSMLTVMVAFGLIFSVHLHREEIYIPRRI